MQGPDSAADTFSGAARLSEPDRTLAALLAPRHARDDLVLLAAFLGELARIPRVVSDPRLAEIRLQWWVEATEGLGADAPATGHPLADAVRAMAERRGIGGSELAAVAEARLAACDLAHAADESAFDRVLSGAEGGGFRLAARILGVPMSAAGEEALDAAGVAYGLARTLFSLPEGPVRGVWRLPATWPESAALEATAPENPARAAAIAALIARGATHARAKLRVVHDFPARTTHNFNAAILPCALVEPYLQALERWASKAVRTPGGSAAGTAPTILPLTRVWRLWRAHRRGRI